MSLKRPIGVIAAFVATLASAYGQSPTADLAVVQNVPVQSDANTDVTFDVTVINNGPDSAANVVLTDPVPVGTTFVSVVQNSGPVFSCTTPAPGAAAGAVSCTVASLGNGASANFALVFHIDAGTPPGTFITGVATAATETVDPNVENDSGPAVTQTPPPPVADMRVAMAGPSGAIPDTDVVYTLDLSNGGPGEATSVILEVTIPAEMTLVSTTQTAGPALCCTSDLAGVTCTVLSFGAGATASLTIVGHIPLGTTSGTTFANFANVSSNFDPNTENDAATTLLCVQTDSCQAGPCNGQTAIVCPAADQCHTQGTCNVASGLCAANPPKIDGIACNDGNNCTPSDSCQSGVCIGIGAVICPAADQCHHQGFCAGVPGACAPNVSRTDGTACNDGNACTASDSCQSGVCQGSNAVSCDDGDACTTDVCDIVAGCLHVGRCDAGSGDAPPGDASANPPPDAAVAVLPDAAPAGVADAAPAGVADARPPGVADARPPGVADGPARIADAAARDAAASTAPADATVPVLADAAPVVRADAGVAGPAADARAGTPDAASAPPGDEGCNCRAAGRGRSSPPLSWLVLLGLFVVRRARRRRP
jgi:uncharacterized repeat protein (TIGR01451 family)/MYXO-CTERM domain-containing protein